MTGRLDSLVADAVRDLDHAAGGQAVCTFTRAGVAVPGIKYAEGRWAALSEVARAVRHGDPVAAAADRVRMTWRHDLERVRARGAGQDWIAYRSGGLDALDELVPDVEDGAP